MDRWSLLIILGGRKDNDVHIPFNPVHNSFVMKRGLKMNRNRIINL